jgi:hypothetical protein
MYLNPYVFAIDMSRSNLCFMLCLLERGVQVTTYDFGFMDNSITNQFVRSLYAKHKVTFAELFINLC